MGYSTYFAFGRMYRNGQTIHTIPPAFLGTYVCTDATYKGAIHLYGLWLALTSGSETNDAPSFESSRVSQILRLAMGARTRNKGVSNMPILTPLPLHTRSGHSFLHTCV